MFGKKRENKVDDDFVTILDDVFPKVKDEAKILLDDIKFNIKQKNITPSEDVDGIFDRIGSFANEQLDKIKSMIPEKYKELKECIEKIGGIGSLIKLCWRVEIKETEQFSLEELIEWAKLNIDPSRHSAACLFVVKATSPFEYHVCFLDKNDKPLLSGADSHLVVYTNSIDKDLSSALGAKNMLLLK